MQHPEGESVCRGQHVCSICCLCTYSLTAAVSYWCSSAVWSIELTALCFLVAHYNTCKYTSGRAVEETTRCTAYSWVWLLSLWSWLTGQTWNTGLSIVTRKSSQSLGSRGRWRRACVTPNQFVTDSWFFWLLPVTQCLFCFIGSRNKDQSFNHSADIHLWLTCWWDVSFQTNAWTSVNTQPESASLIWTVTPRGNMDLQHICSQITWTFHAPLLYWVYYWAIRRPSHEPSDQRVGSTQHQDEMIWHMIIYQVYIYYMFISGDVTYRPSFVPSRSSVPRRARRSLW